MSKYISSLHTPTRQPYYGHSLSVHDGSMVHFPGWCGLSLGFGPVLHRDTLLIFFVFLFFIVQGPVYVQQSLKSGFFRGSGVRCFIRAQSPFFFPRVPFRSFRLVFRVCHIKHNFFCRHQNQNGRQKNNFEFRIIWSKFWWGFGFLSICRTKVVHTCTFTTKLIQVATLRFFS